MGININSFGNAVGALDADVVDLNNLDDLFDAVDVAVSNILRDDSIDIQELVRLLESSISGGDGNEFAMLLAKTTNVDWLYDQKNEALLIEVAKNFLDAIEHYRRVSRLD